MKKNNKGFVVSAVLYPLLILFLAIIMGLLSMSDTRKRILDKMKLEISNSIFDESECSCDTILNKLNYLIKNGVSGGGGNGEFSLIINSYETSADIPFSSTINSIAIIPLIEYNGIYSISNTKPINPVDGMIWISLNDKNYLTLSSSVSRIPLGLCYQFINDEWGIIPAYAFIDNAWQKFSDGFNNWKIMASLGGVDYSIYENLSDLLKDKRQMQLIIDGDNAMNYIVNSRDLLSTIKKDNSYSSVLVPLFLESTVYSNDEKFNYKLPYYIYNKGDTKYSFTKTAGCSLGVISSYGLNMNSSSFYFYSSQSCNCCGGVWAGTNTAINVSEYSRVGTTLTSFSKSYSSNYITFGLSTAITFNNSLINSSLTGTGNFYTSNFELTGSYYIRFTTGSCSNENNNSNGTSLSGTVSKLWLE